MRERLITLACALAALLLFATLFWHGNTVAERPSLPTTNEAGDNGLLGALNWLQEEGVHTLSLRERFGALEQRADLTPTGNLLIVSMPAATSFRNDEVAALERWIRKGNTLLVLAALADRPRWARSALVMDGDLQLLTGLEMMRAVDPAAEKKAPHAVPAGREPASDPKRPADSVATLLKLTRDLDKPQPRSLVANRRHPYFREVEQATSYSDFPPRDNTLAVPRDGFALSLAHAKDSGVGAFWIRPEGAGAVIVSGFASLFSNRALGVTDNARLLANLVAATTLPNGTVVFDDEHQGLTAAYDPGKFYRDPRLYATIATLALVWLTWVLGGTQLKMPVLRSGAAREAELVRTTGLFLARVLQPAAAARRMFEHFFHDVRRRAPPESAGADGLFEWLANHPRLRRAEVRQLRQWYADACADRRVPLSRLHNLLVLTERQLAA